ncbi:MAG: protein translocase subunit SecF [Gammaproteobacteria bacterium]|nr:protein translocase subunit SecF [Gammaproteobacteria bacterium]
MRFLSRPPNIDWVGQRKRALALSIVVSLACLTLLFTRGLNLGIDFTGGVLVEVSYPVPAQLDTVRQELKAAGYEEATVQFFGSASDVLIRLPAPKSEAVGSAGEKQQSSAISARVLQALGARDKGITLRRVDFVGPAVGAELKQKGTLALLAAFFGIFLYIMFRFEWKFSLGSIAALTHDAIMTLGYLSLVREEFDLTVLAGVLAMLGYSNNESIVLFDRVRENLLNLRKRSVEEIVNLSINQTLMRSVVTHFTVLLVLLALHYLGGKSVHGFSVAMMVGVIVATYSSIYISSGVAILLHVKREDLLPPKLEEIDHLP